MMDADEREVFALPRPRPPLSSPSPAPSPAPGLVVHERWLQTKALDLGAEEPLRVNIADALNDHDLVKFTVHTKARGLAGGGCVLKAT